MMEVGWEDPREFKYRNDGNGLALGFAIDICLVEVGLKEMEKAEPLPTIYNDTAMANAFHEELRKATNHAERDSIHERWGVIIESSPLDLQRRIIVDPQRETIDEPLQRADFTGPVGGFSSPRYGGFYKLARRFRDDGDTVKFINDTDTDVCIMCTQDLMTVLKNGGGGVNAGPGGVDVRVDVANQMVQVKEIKTILKLEPKGSQDVLIAPKYVMVSVFADRGGTMTLLYHNVLLKKGYNHTVEQKDINNALTQREVEQLNLLAA